MVFEFFARISALPTLRQGLRLKGFFREAFLFCDQKRKRKKSRCSEAAAWRRTTSAAILQPTVQFHVEVNAHGRIWNPPLRQHDFGPGGVNAEGDVLGAQSKARALRADIESAPTQT